LEPGVFSEKQMKRWCTEDFWGDRAAAHDQWRQEEWSKEVDRLLGEGVRERAARHLSLLTDMQELAAAACREALEDLAKGNRLGWSPQEIARVVKEAMTLERLVRGEVTERTEHRLVADLTKLSFAEIEQLRELEAKATGEELVIDAPAEEKA
jgi:hypothetical protein